jgi:hypothetical protein
MWNSFDSAKSTTTIADTRGPSGAPRCPEISGCVVAHLRTCRQGPRACVRACVRVRRVRIGVADQRKKNSGHRGATPRGLAVAVDLHQHERAHKPGLMRFFASWSSQSQTGFSVVATAIANLHRLIAVAVIHSHWCPRTRQMSRGAMTPPFLAKFTTFSLRAGLTSTVHALG